MVLLLLAGLANADSTTTTPFSITGTSSVIAWSGVIFAIVFILLGIAFMVSKVFGIPAWEAWVKDEVANVIFSAFIVIMFITFTGVIEAASSSLASDILSSTQSGGQTQYWSYNAGTGRWSEATTASCLYPCHMYLARGFLGSTYEIYGRTLKSVAKEYSVSSIFESLGIGSTMDLLFFTKLDIQIGYPLGYGRAIYDNALSTVTKEYLPVLATLKTQEIALSYLVGLSNVFFVIGILTRIFWPTRKFGGLLVAIAIGIYAILPLVYVMAWYAIDRSSASFNDPIVPASMDVISNGESVGTVSLDPLFTKYDSVGRVSQIGVLDGLARAYLCATVIPLLAIFTTIGFVRHFSMMIGGDTELAGLTKII